MRLNEGQQAFILLSLAEKLEGDAARAHRPHHGSDFDGSFVFGKDDLQVKDIVNPHVSVALDDAPAHGEVEDGPLTPDLSTGKRQAQTNRNTKVLPSLDHMGGSRRARTTGEETMATVSALERNDANQRGREFARRLRPYTECSVLSAAWASRLAAHPVSAPSASRRDSALTHLIAL